MGQSDDRLIVALDYLELDSARDVVKRLKGLVRRFKVGSVLYTAAGPAAVVMVQEAGGEVFLDLKFHDIPNTVSLAARAVAAMDVWMFTLHLSGGKEMLRRASESARLLAGETGRRRPLAIGVTVLTSIDESVLRDEMGVGRPLVEQAVFLTGLGLETGLDGVVASPEEILAIRSAFGEKTIIITPGVRPSWATRGDQKRVMTPREAIEAGADYIVVGRPVTAAEDPASAAARILEEFE